MLKQKDEEANSGEEVTDYDSMIGSDDDESVSSEENDEEDVSVEEEIKSAPKNVPAAVKRKAEIKPQAAPNAVKKSKHEKVKPPTLEEINELKETRNLFHSNLFRLQVKELLTELKVKDKYKNFVNNWLETFKHFVKSLPAEFSDTKWLEKTKLKVPLLLNCLQGKKREFQFEFRRPIVEPFFIGAAATETLLGPKLVVDVCLTMPAACFEKEDYLNLIYEQKRALYLVFVANEMLRVHFEEIELEQMKFNFYNNNPLKPVLEFIPNGKANAKQKVCIRLFVAAEESTFKLNRFVPWNNNIRSKIFDEAAEDDVLVPTPHYNSNVLFDLTMQTNSKAVDEVFKGNKNFQEGLVLLKVWLQQRQLNVGFTGFSAHILAMFICYLQRQHKLHKNMSSYQVARTVWNQLAHSAWDTHGQGITLCTQSLVAIDKKRPTLAQFHEHFNVVFIDDTGYHNICANVTLQMYQRVRYEAKLAVDMLNDMKLNSFQALFMTKYPLYTQFDHILKISKRDSIEQILEMHVPMSVKQNFVGYTFPQLLKTVGALIEKGLGKRIQTFLPIEVTTPSWSCTSLPDFETGRHLQIGLILDPNQAYEVLDKGPESIDAEAAAEFRRFWGDKAKLRRFQDGTITESVVWGTVDDTLSQKRLVTRAIVLHLLQHHFQLDATDVTYIAGELDIVYKLTPAYKTEHMHEKFKVKQDTDAEALCLSVIRIWDDLARKLHALKELPLEIVTIVGSSPVFRYCEPTPLLPTARVIGEDMYASSVQHGIIQLALSGKWPSELAALQAMKTAFYIQIAELLRQKHRLQVKVTYDGLLVIKQGYCFSIEIAHPKELALLKQSKTERGIVQYVDTGASIELEKRHYVVPKVNGALHALHHQYPSFGATVMIAKRWLYAQLIDSGLWPDECTELLVAILFLRIENTQQISCSPQTGFLRFLHLLAHADWKAELFLLNFNNTFDENQISDLEQNFNASREQFPPLCIATSYDRGHYGKLWSNAQQPNVNVIARVTLLARQALEMIEPCLLQPEETFLKLSNLFVPSTQGYDLVIQLRPDEVPNTTAFDFGSSFTAFSRPNWRLPLAGLNHLSTAVEKLRQAYGDFAAFFYNPCGGKTIGIVWKPSAFEEKEFKVTDLNACQLTSNQKLQCSRDTLIEDFKFILKDFYLRIDTVQNVLEASKQSALCSRPTNSVAKNRSSTNRYFSGDISKTKNENVRTGKLKIIKNVPPKIAKKSSKTTQKKQLGKKTKTVKKKCK